MNLPSGSNHLCINRLSMETDGADRSSILYLSVEKVHFKWCLYGCHLSSLFQIFNITHLESRVTQPFKKGSCFQVAKLASKRYENTLIQFHCIQYPTFTQLVTI